MFKNIFKKRKRVLEKSHLDSIISYLTKYTRDDLRFYIKDGYRLEKKSKTPLYVIYGYGEDVGVIEVDKNGKIKYIRLFDACGDSRLRGLWNRKKM